MKRKITLIVLGVVVLGSALVACSGTATTTEESTVATESTATSTTEESAVATETTTTDTDSSSETAMEAPPEGEAPGGGSTTVDTGTGAYVLTDGETLAGGTYTSTNADENAVRAEGDVTASWTSRIFQTNG